jgi:hypothetical protein
VQLLALLLYITTKLWQVLRNGMAWLVRSHSGSRWARLVLDGNSFKVAAVGPRVSRPSVLWTLLVTALVLDLNLINVD